MSPPVLLNHRDCFLITTYVKYYLDITTCSAFHDNSQDSSDGQTTDESELDSWQGQDTFLLSKAFGLWSQASLRMPEGGGG
jgi:hypothetical protein